jgi:four helix bundle protein
VTGFKRFEEIRAWQRARELVHDVYGACRTRGLARDFSLRDQLSRASVSAMSNIAEGFARNSHRDFAHFLDIARGSCSEVQSLLYVALDAGYLTQEEFDKLYDSAQATAAMIGRLTTHLRNTASPAPEVRG